ncbi:MAG: crosslink repair DNA glycosylase YcaQ family protein [Candidatus Limnocylindrales bacterium]
MAHPLDVTREQVLAFRRRVGALDERLPPGAASLRQAAWAGLSDSMPRGALLSIHARVAGAGPSAWEDPSLAQVWGPRFSAYVVPAMDVAVFTLGRMPPDGPRTRFGNATADRLEAFLAGRTLPYSEAGRGLGVVPNSLRYAAPTGRVRIRWDGARQPTIWTVPPPAMDAADARMELARRYLHVMGPGSVTGYGSWAGIKPQHASATFEALGRSLVAVRTPIGDAWILAEDEAELRGEARPAAPARLLPSGDVFYLLQGIDRELLVPDADQRARLWTSRVWPGALLLDGQVAGTWRRSDAVLTVEPWRQPSPEERDAVQAEAESLPLPGAADRIQVRWAS